MNDWFEAEQRVERAQQLAESRRWTEALAELDAALEINPSNGVWLAHRGYVLDQGVNAYTDTGRNLLRDPKVIELYLGTLARAD